ncbi:MAG: AAA family ATPase, partial [Halanaerobiales bacterium]|nr:AAA family ATPase [Halanaerobiales bacterium]
NIGIKGEELEERVIKALDMAGVREELHKTSPFNLSGGEMRLAAIAGVLAMKPDYLVLDEPLSGLDPENQKSLILKLKKLHQEGISIIIVSHRISELLSFADRVFLMENGKITFDGRPEEYVNSLPSTLPQIAALMRELRLKGIDVRDDIFTVEDAFDEIIRVQKERMRQDS